LVTKNEANTVDKENGGIASRLGMVAKYKPELWEGLVARVAEELGARGINGDKLAKDMSQLDLLPQNPDTEVDLSEEAWSIILPWLNYHLPTGWANALTLTKVRKSYVARLIRLGFRKEKQKRKPRRWFR